MATDLSVVTEDCENFDALTVGGLVAEQLGGMWSTWSGTSADDATVTDAESNSPDNSFIVDAGTVDLIFMFDEEPISTGQWVYSHYMYVPSGMDGYFNVQTEPTPGVGWNIEITFAPDGTGVFAGGATDDFTYTMDTWFMVEVNYDFASGYAQILFDGDLILQWENVETIGAIDYYGAGTNPEAYFDDVCFMEGWEIEPPVLPDPPTNLTGPESVLSGEDIELMWDAPGGGAGEMIELVQHDGQENNGWYQSYDNGYGVVYDLAAYPGATIEMVDFRHSSWGVTGTWDYKIRIVDWDTYTELAELGPFQTTGNDAWEQEVDLGSYAGASGMVGIFMEPMGNDPADAYPCIDFDAGLDGTSFYGPLADYSGMAINDGDFLMDLWIMTAGEKQLVKPAKVPVNSLVGNGIARNPSTPVMATELTVNQKENKGAKELTGYNVYRKFNTGSFQMIDYVTETMYTDNVPVPGAYTYYVTAVYDPEGESEGSNEWVVDVIVGIDEMLANSTQLFPNPATDHVNINAAFTIESVTIYNFAGQAVLTESVNNTTYRINTSEFHTGVYLFQINTREGRICKRVIIE
jgi:hypothetical protein